MKPSHSLATLACLLLLLLPLSAQEQTNTVRIIGLSDPSREEDFHTTLKAIPELTLVSLDAHKANAVLRYELSAIITKPKPKPEDLEPAKVLEQINNLVGKASERTFSLTPPTGVAEEALAQIDIQIGILDCKGCRYGAYLAIAKLDGVERATVDSAKRTLTAWIDPTKTTKEALEASLKKARIELP